MLKMFQKHGIHATWATVGLQFARYEEYDPKYIRWISSELIEVEVVYYTYQHNGKREVKYRVYVNIDDDKCYPNVPERILE